MNNYERGEADALEKGMAAIRVLLAKLEDAKNNATEWKEQHENLLAMFRASELRAAKAEAALRARPEVEAIKILREVKGNIPPWLSDYKRISAFLDSLEPQKSEDK